MLARKSDWIAAAYLITSLVQLGYSLPTMAEVGATDGSAVIGTSPKSKTSPANVAKAKALVTVAYTQIKRRQFSAAVKSLLNAIHTDPDNLFARRCLAYALLYSGSAESAMQQMQVIGRMSPNTTGYDVCMLGEILLNTGEYEEAKACFKRVLAVQPNCRWAIGGMVKATALAHDCPSALRLCQDGINRSKNQTEKSYFVTLEAFVQRVAAISERPEMSESQENGAEPQSPPYQPTPPIGPSGQPQMGPNMPPPSMQQAPGKPLIHFPSPMELRGIMGGRG